MRGRCAGCGTAHPESATHCIRCGRIFKSSVCTVHRDRIADRACLVCSRTLCLSCRFGSRHAPVCQDHQEVRIVQGWAEVAQYPDEVTALLTTERLRSHDIEATILSQKDRWHVVSFGGLAVIRVLVPASMFVEARRVLDSRSSSGSGLPE